MTRWSFLLLPQASNHCILRSSGYGSMEGTRARSDLNRTLKVHSSKFTVYQPCDVFVDEQGGFLWRAGKGKPGNETTEVGEHFLAPHSAGDSKRYYCKEGKQGRIARQLIKEQTPSIKSTFQGAPLNFLSLISLSL